MVCLNLLDAFLVFSSDVENIWCHALDFVAIGTLVMTVHP